MNRSILLWKGGRVVECNGLENRRGCKPLVSSNLTLSANMNIPRGCFFIGVMRTHEREFVHEATAQ